jgi:hypothetical protein
MTSAGWRQDERHPRLAILTGASAPRFAAAPKGALGHQIDTNHDGAPCLAQVETERDDELGRTRMSPVHDFVSR